MNYKLTKDDIPFLCLFFACLSNSQFHCLVMINQGSDVVVVLFPDLHMLVLGTRRLASSLCETALSCQKNSNTINYNSVY